MYKVRIEKDYKVEIKEFSNRVEASKFASKAIDENYFSVRMWRVYKDGHNGAFIVNATNYWL